MFANLSVTYLLLVPSLSLAVTFFGSYFKIIVPHLNYLPNIMNLIWLLSVSLLYAFILLIFPSFLCCFLFPVLLHILFSLTLFANLIKVFFISSPRQLKRLLNKNMGFVALSLHTLLQISGLVVHKI